MHPFPHRIRPNHTSPIPGNHLALAVSVVRHPPNESQTHWTQTLAAWGAESFRWEGQRATRPRYGSSETDCDLWSFLASHATPERSLWVWSPQAPQTWQLCGIYGALDDGRLTLESAVITDKVNLLATRLNGARVLWLDLSNWWREPIGKLAKLVGIDLPEQPGEIAEQDDYQLHASRKASVVKRMVAALCARVKADDLGCMRPTVAGQSMSAYRHRWMHHPIEVHGRPSVSKAERLAYHGGRVIQNYRGVVVGSAAAMDALDRERWPRMPVLAAGPIYYLDAQSLYPAMMAHHTHPWRCVGRLPTTCLIELQRLMRQYWCIARVRIRTDGEQYPVRINPATLLREGDYERTETGTTVSRGTVPCYPAGDYWTILPQPELQMAAERGRLAGVSGAICYAHANLFGGWVSEWYNRRRRAEQESVEGNLTKSILTALYGKFTSKAPAWEKTTRAPIDGIRWGYDYDYDWDGNKLITYRITAGVCYKKVENPDEGFDSVVSIGANITSLARVTMQRWIDMLPPRSLLYSDTDSLHVLPEGYEVLKDAGEIRPGELGALRIKGVWDWACYLGPKVYRSPDTTTLCGLQEGSTRVGPTTWKVRYAEGSARLATRAPTGVVSEVEQLRDFSCGALLGRVGSDGWVAPLELHGTRELDEE